MRIFDGCKEITAFCTDKNDGNFADYVGYEEADVNDNRDAFNKKQNGKIVLLKQIHGNEVLEIKSPSLSQSGGGFWFADEADGMTTNEAGLILAIQTADCAGVLLYDAANRAVAALHAGRKGTQLNILNKCVAKMQNLYGTNAADLKMFVGTRIRGCCYELPTEMAAEFAIYGGAVTARENKSYLDIGNVLRIQAKNIGIKDENIEIEPSCSSCESEKFFSYRAENGKCGRMLTAIGLKAI